MAGLVLGAAIVDVITALAVALGALNAKHVELALDITITIRPPGARRVVDRSASPRYLPRVSLVRTLPAGFIEAGETPQVAALRETFEEAGVSGLIVARAGSPLRFESAGRSLVTPGIVAMAWL